jgi:alpha-1,2-mannosyltransferase
MPVAFSLDGRASPDHTLAFSLGVNGAHLTVAVAGFYIIHKVANSNKHGRHLWPVTLTLSALTATFLFFVSDPATPFQDFRSAYWQAGAAIWGGPQRLAGIYQSNVFGFVNLPVVSYFFAPFGLLPERLGAVAFSMVGGAALIYAWDATARMLSFEREQRALALFALAVYGPLIHSLRQANASHLVLAMVVWALMSARTERSWWSGAGFGFAALIKPPLLLIGVYFFLRGKWKIVLAGTAVLAAATVLSIAVFGWALHVVWYEACIKPFVGGVVVAFNAQSIASVLARFEFGRGMLWDWTPYVPSAFTKVAIQIVSLAMIGMAFWACRKGKTQLEIELALVLALICLISSLSWSHYFVWLLPGFAIIFIRTAHKHDAPQLRWSFLAAFALAAPAQFLSAPMATGIYPGALLLTSHLAIAGVVVFALLCTLRSRTA